jgi:hypothetical protein
VGKKGMAILALWPYNIQHTHTYIYIRKYISLYHICNFTPKKPWTSSSLKVVLDVCCRFLGFL